MKLEKFNAASMTEALGLIQNKLGPEAIIYSQTSTPNGIEIVAGLPKPEASKIQGSSKTERLDADNEQFADTKPSPTPPPRNDSWLEQFQSISKQELNSELQMMEKLNLLQLKLRKLNFTHEFIENVAQMHAQNASIDAISSNETIIKIMLSKIKIQETELIDTQKICALIGPTGIGKSTTVAKIAKRFASKYGAEHLGIISTDFQRIITKNQFHYFGKLLNIQIEYARDSNELQEAIHILQDKKFILIDTAGVSQYDNKKVAELVEKLTVKIPNIALYVVMPCNLQSDILDEVLTQFKMPHTVACIMTKVDECKSIAPCLSVIMNHSMPIAYWCDGQNLVRDIHIPSQLNLINAVFHGERNAGFNALPA